MMKKNVTLITWLLVLVFCLTGCGSNANEVNDLRQKVDELEAQIEELEEKQELANNMIANLQTATREASENADNQNAETNAENEANENLDGEAEPASSNETTQELINYLDKQISSNNFDNWLEVAECDYVTSEQLLTIAEKCAQITSYEGYSYKAERGQQKLADAIVANSAVTDEVLRQLLESKYVSIWIKAISSDKCSKETLIQAAEMCVEITSYDGYSYKAEEGQKIVATAILESEALTDEVVRKLLDSKYASIWFEALASDKCSEETLIQAAQMCVQITSYEGYSYKAENGQLAMAEVILNNPSVTENVLKEFANSKYASVASIGHQNIEMLATSE